MNAPPVRDVTAITRITRDTDATEIALAVYDRLLDLLEDLDEPDWDRRVPDCPAWTVADTVGHMIGAAHGHASVPQMLRQTVLGQVRKGRFEGNDLDAMNDVQVRDHAALSPPERVTELRRIAPRAVQGRMRMPGPVRRAHVPIAATGSTTGMPSRLQLGHLMDAVLSRDVWMHRVDIARATGREVSCDQPSDTRVVEDVVAEWAAAHGRPVDLVLTGPAGGVFRSGDGGPHLEFDAVEFCRVVSGRAPGEGLLATHVLF